MQTQVRLESKSTCCRQGKSPHRQVTHKRSQLLIRSDPAPTCGMAFVTGGGGSSQMTTSPGRTTLLFWMCTRPLTLTRPNLMPCCSCERLTSGSFAVR